MEEAAQLRFGDRTTADVKLWLTGPNDEKYEGNPVHLHSVVLNRSEFFKVKMSERWSSDKADEMRVTTSQNFDDYLKCIQLMYVEFVYFSGVEECLAILLVAFELLCDELINKCMQYLEAIPWSTQQEIQIRDVLSSLGLKPIPDLAARLDNNDDDDITFVESTINEMVSIISGPKSAPYREIAEKYIADILEGNTSKENVELYCEQVLYQKTKLSIASRNFKAMRYLFEFFERCREETLKTAFMAFCEDSEIMEYVNTECCKDSTDNSYYMFPTILCFMQAIGNGKIIVSRASRVSFLTKWLPILAKACSGSYYNLTKLDNAVLNIVESLPLVDRRRICVEWIGIYRKHDLDFGNPFTLLKDLEDAYHKSTSTRCWSPVFSGAYRWHIVFGA